MVLTNSGLFQGSINVAAAVSGLSGASSGPFGGSTLQISGFGFGSDASQITVSVGDEPCDVTDLNMDGTSLSCTVPALADSMTTLTASGTAVRTGKFSPAEVTVKSGTKVTFAWDFMLDSGIQPTIQLSSQLFTLPTVDANAGSGFFVFDAPGSYLVSTGLYDGSNEITATVNVEAREDTEASTQVTVGPSSLDVSGVSGRGRQSRIPGS